jgi:hypothetical protein
MSNFVLRGEVRLGSPGLQADKNCHQNNWDAARLRLAVKDVQLNDLLANTPAIG